MQIVYIYCVTIYSGETRLFSAVSGVGNSTNSTRTCYNHTTVAVERDTTTEQVDAIAA